MKSPTPSALVPRRAPNIPGRVSARYPDLNFQALGKTLGITPTHLGRILNGRSRPSIKLAQRIAALMGWTVDQVVELYIAKSKPESESEESKPNAKSRNNRKATRIGSVGTVGGRGGPTRRAAKTAHKPTKAK